MCIECKRKDDVIKNLYAEIKQLDTELNKRDNERNVLINKASLFTSIGRKELQAS